MKKRILWIITAVLFAIFSVLNHSSLRFHDPSNALKFDFYLLDIGYNVIVVLLTAGILSALTALIPYHKISYRQKFSSIFPITTLIVVAILLFAFSYSVYLEKVKGMRLESVANIHVPKGLIAQLSKMVRSKMKTLSLKGMMIYKLRLGKLPVKKNNIKLNGNPIANIGYHLLIHQRRNIKSL